MRRECNLQRMIVGDPSQGRGGEYGGGLQGGLISGATRLLSLQHRIRLDRRMRSGTAEGGAADAGGSERDGAAGGAAAGGERGKDQANGGAGAGSGASKVAADEFDIKLFQQRAKQAELARCLLPTPAPTPLSLILDSRCLTLLYLSLS